MSTLELYLLMHISIHALREEGDHVVVPLVFDFDGFLSTPSARRATFGHHVQELVFGISIHALREEGDLEIQKEKDKQKQFLSTPSARRATGCGRSAQV